MADNPTVYNGALTDYAVSADEGAGGYVQRIKLAYAADGSEVHVPADADGLLVNLGTNNDVTVTGTVTANLGATDNTVLDNIDADTSAIQTAVELIDDTVAVLGTATYLEGTTKGLIMGAVRRDADTSLANTTNEVAPLQVDANGYLKVEVFDGGGTHTVDAPVGTPVFVRLSDGSAAITTLAVSLASVPSHAVTNAGTFAVQVDGNALTALQLIDDPVFADDAAFTIGTSKVMMAGATVDETSTDSADEADAVALRASANRQLIVTPRPNASGEGLDIFRSLDLDETEEEIKATAGKLYGYFFFNAATSTRYLKFYNATAANTTVGTTTPILTFPLPAGVAGHVEFSLGIPFATALSGAVTTGLADNDTGAPGASEVIVNVFYK